MKIKVCGMKIPANIEAISELEIDFMGFIFYAPSPRYAIDTLKERPLPKQNISGVGVFVNEDNRTAQQILKKYQLKKVQLHGSESPDYCQKMKAAGFTVIKAFRMAPDFDFSLLEKYMPVCDYFLFDTKGKTHGGTGKQFDWSILQHYIYEKPFFLSGGIGPKDADQIKAFQHPQLYALDLNSRFELKPGLKNVEALQSFIESSNLKIKSR